MTNPEPNCISEHRDDYGYTWIYHHSDDEPSDTLDAAIAVAPHVAGVEAAKDGKTYVVASLNAPSVAIYVLPFGHPMILNRALSIMYQLMPDGRSIRSPKPQRH
jgi:hypothetical protein